MKTNKTITVAVRLTPAEKEKLIKLSTAYEDNLSLTIRALINKEYNKLQS